MPDIANLLTASEMVARLNNRISEERLLELCESKLVPHFELEGVVLFGKSETERWLRDNLLTAVPAMPVPNRVAVTPIVLHDTPAETPQELASVAAYLIPMPIGSLTYATFSGVYFLCRGGKVVYVGQSANVAGRVGKHCGAKEFDYAFCMRVPKSDLNFVEGEFIRALEPEYNLSKTGRLVAPTGPGTQYGSKVMADFVNQVATGRQ